MVFESNDATSKKCEVQPNTSASLAQQTNCGDQTSVKTTDTSTQHVPPVDLFDSGDLSYADMQTKAQALSSALQPDLMHLRFGSDYNNAMNIIGEMTAPQMEKFVEVYNALPNTPDLLDDAKAHLDGVQFRAFETKVNAVDGQTNFAGNIAQFLERANQFFGTDDAGSQMRQLFGHMSSADFELVKEQWAKGDYAQYGSFDQMIANSKLSDVDKNLYTMLYSKGRDNWTAADIENAAKYIVGSVNGVSYGPQDALLKIYGDVVGGNTPAAEEARAALLKDQDFCNAYNNVFGSTRYNVRGTKYADDYLNYGAPSLATEVNDGTTWQADLFGNSADIDAQIASVADKDRATYTAGRLIAESGVQPTTDEQAQQLAFYSKTHDALNNKGDQQAAIWEDNLENKRSTIISDIASQSKAGTLTGETAQLALDKLSEQDWNLLHSENGTPTSFSSELQNAIKKFVPLDAQQALLERIQDLSGMKSYSEVQQSTRDFYHVVTNNIGSGGNPESIANAVLNMTKEDAAKYADPNHPEFKAAIDAVVFPNMENYLDGRSLNYQDKAAFALAQSLLTQVAQSGQPAKLSAFDTVAESVMNGTAGDDHAMVQTLQTLVQNDPSLLQKAQEIKAKSQLDITAADDAFMTTLYGLTSGHPEVLNNMIEGRIAPIGNQIAAGGLAEGQSFYSFWATEDADEQKWDLDGLADYAQRHVVQHIIDQKGYTDPVDAARLYTTGAGNVVQDGSRAVTYRDLVDQIGQMPDAAREKFLSDYKARYNSDFGTDLINEAVKEGGWQDNNEYLQVLKHIVDQGLKPMIADEIRFAVLDHGDYKALAQEFAGLSFDEKNNQKNRYSSEYNADLDGTFMSLIGNNAAEQVAVSNNLTAGETDFLQDFLDCAKMDQSGAEVDGTKDAVIKAMSQYGDLFAQYAANRDKIPPEVLSQLQNDFVDAVNRNQATKGRVAAAAEAAIDVAIIAAAVVTLIPSGGTSGAAAGVMLAASHEPIIAAIKGNGMITEDEVRSLLASSAIDAALFGGPSAIKSAKQIAEALNGPGRSTLKSLVDAAYTSEYEGVLAADTTGGVVDATNATKAVAADASSLAASDAASVDTVLARPVTSEVAATEPAVAEVAATEPAATLTQQWADAAKVLDGSLKVPTIAALKASDIINNTAPQTDFTPPTPMPSAQLIDLATVKRGEGPWQSAERILAADGKKHGIDEVRALTKAIQAVYAKDNGSGDMSGLKVKYTFVTQDNFDDLLNAVNNDQVKAVLMSLSATPAA